MVRVLIGSFDITRVVNICERISGRNSKNNGLRKGGLFLSSPRLALRAPREISRSPRLAHKAPVMQASLRQLYVFA